MKDKQKVFIKTGSTPDKEAINFIIAFAMETEGWEYPEEQSERYTMLAGVPVCTVVLAGSDSLVFSTIIVMKKESGIFYVPNIIPKTSDSLTLSQYNTIAVAFGVSLRRYFKKNRVPVSVSLPSSEIQIENIIRSKKARIYFEIYLQFYPLSLHYLDIERLDRFTCALAKHSHGSVDFDLFERYLIKELGWQHDDAKWPRKRVETGWDVLQIYKYF